MDESESRADVAASPNAEKADRYGFVMEGEGIGTAQGRQGR